jgi:hypothetical protein
LKGRGFSRVVIGDKENASIVAEGIFPCGYYSAFDAANRQTLRDVNRGRDDLCQRRARHPILNHPFNVLGKQGGYVFWCIVTRQAGKETLGNFEILCLTHDSSEVASTVPTELQPSFKSRHRLLIPGSRNCRSLSATSRPARYVFPNGNTNFTKTTKTSSSSPAAFSDTYKRHSTCISKRASWP